MQDDVIEVLAANHAITTVNFANTGYQVAAGGFQSVTDPSYVFNVKDAGFNAVSAGDVDVLDNLLGYALNQNGTEHFSPDNPKAYDFLLHYGVVSFTRDLTGVEAKGFVDYLGRHGRRCAVERPERRFTQVAFAGSPFDNSMLFLRPSTSKQEFVTRLSRTAHNTPLRQVCGAYQRRTAHNRNCRCSFPFNDWVAFPKGDQYPAHLHNPSALLLKELAAPKVAAFACGEQLARCYCQGPSERIPRPSAEVSIRSAARFGGQAVRHHFATIPHEQAVTGDHRMTPRFVVKNADLR